MASPCSTILKSMGNGDLVKTLFWLRANIHGHLEGVRRDGIVRVGIVGGGELNPPQFMSTDAHFWVKIGFKFQSMGKISYISADDPPSSFRSIPTLGIVEVVGHVAYFVPAQCYDLLSKAVRPSVRHDPILCVKTDENVVFFPARRYASAGNSDRNVSVLSVCPSVCPSVTRRYCVKTKKLIVMISSPSGSPNRF